MRRQASWREDRRPSRLATNWMPGLVSTDGGLVFGSDQSTFFALDIDSGELLWSAETGGKQLAEAQVTVTMPVMCGWSEQKYL